MPFAENQGAKLYWDEEGQGEPLLLIMGLGYTSCMWHRTRPGLAQHFRTIAFDNRGVGLSSVPPGPYSIATMASDAAAVLDAAGIASAHVFGVSMGGMIAQEFALQCPARTRSLVLGCTSAGGPSTVRAETNVIDILLARGMTPSKRGMPSFIEKPCGEGLMPDSLEALRQIGVTIGAEHSFPFRGIRFLTCATSVCASFPAASGLGMRRTVLHQLLADRAAELGVQFLWGARVSGISNEGVVVNGGFVRSRWIVGADGQNSHVRRWAGLDACQSYKRRFGFRRHYQVTPWSDCVEIYWGSGFQFYVTPVSPREVCMVLISRHRHLRIDRALEGFPELRERLNSDCCDQSRTRRRFGFLPLQPRSA